MKEQRAAVAGHLEGKSYTKIAAELDLHRNTVAKIVNDTDIVETLAERKIRYVDDIFNARTTALKRLKDQLDANITIITTENGDQVVSALSVDQLTKLFGQFDQAIERNIKISSGYYLSHDKLKTQVIPGILASVARHVTDQAVLTAIANDLAEIDLE